MHLTRETDEFLSAKRARKNERRRRRVWRQEQSRQKRYEKIRTAFGRRSQVVKMIAGAYTGEITDHKGGLKLAIPQAFSVIEAPEHTLSAVGALASASRKRRLRTVFLDHSGMEVYDLAANAILDVTAVELVTEATRAKGRMRWRGTYPKDKNVRRFIRAMGIIKHLNLAHEFPDADELSELRLFDVRNRHYYRAVNPTKVDFKSKIVGQFSDHIDMCLRDHGRTLTPQARHNLCEYTGEILDNAEEHSQFLDWSIQGYLDNSLTEPLCEIAIFNFGHTIADTLKALPRTSYTWMQIAPYMNQHRKFKWFGPSWSEDDLLTLIALQSHVSSKNSSEHDTRGNGTIDLIEFFQQVHEECAKGCKTPAKMAIMSGSTHVLFDGKYRLGTGLSGTKTIAFNSANDLNEKPDPIYVRGLKGFRFPGTAISIRFPLSVSTTTAELTAPNAARN